MPLLRLLHAVGDSVPVAVVHGEWILDSEPLPHAVTERVAAHHSHCRHACVDAVRAV